MKQYMAIRLGVGFKDLFDGYFHPFLIYLPERDK